MQRGRDMRLRDFSVLTFDCYGTLIDWETGILASLRPLAARSALPLGDDDILEAHARCESRRQAQTPGRLYPDLLAAVHADLAAEWGVAALPQEGLAHGASVGQWPAFADCAPALAYLKEHYRLAVLSNVHRQGFAASNARLGVAFDAVFTAEDTGAYKPSERGFLHMLAALEDMGFAKAEILHTAESLFHDHVPANRLGLASCHIHRRRGRSGFGATMAPRSMPSCAFRFPSLAEMAAAHRRECRA